MHHTLRFWTIAVTAFLSILCASQPTMALPLDGRAGGQIGKLTKLFSQPLKERTISGTTGNELRSLASVDSSDCQLIAVLGLAFSTDQRDQEVIQELARHGQGDEVKGAAKYALQLRSVIGKSPDQILAHLLQRLEISDDPFERLYVANRLFIDFPEKSMNAILAAAKRETNKSTKMDLLYYLVQSNDKSIARQTLALSWDEKVIMPESMAMILGVITPGRSKDQFENSSFVLLKILRGKAA